MADKESRTLKQELCNRIFVPSPSDQMQGSHAGLFRLQCNLYECIIQQTSKCTLEKYLYYSNSSSRPHGCELHDLFAIMRAMPSKISNGDNNHIIMPFSTQTFQRTPPNCILHFSAWIIGNQEDGACTCHRVCMHPLKGHRHEQGND
jgi:hypothetical protein